MLEQVANREYVTAATRRESRADARPATATSAPTKILGLGALLAAFHVANALWLHRSRLVVALVALVVVGCLLARRLSPARRAQAAFLLVTAVLGLHGYELHQAFRHPRAATAAWLSGRSWDARQITDLRRDELALGREVWPAIRPRLLYRWRKQGLAIRGREVLPLAGISRVATVLGNESGQWVQYTADEHGFSNPPELWGTPIDLAVIGDSFAHGAYVPPDRNLVAVLRRAHPATLNLGMVSNGPLFELATIIEYVPALKPKRVLWLYFRNDLADLEVERRSPLLRRYLDEPGFTQGLVDAQPALDTALKSTIQSREGRMEWWPRVLATAGLTRGRSPVWLQDLVMRRHDSSWSAALRLDHTYQALGYPVDPDTRPAPGDFTLFRKVLERARSVVAASGAELVFVYLPDLWPAAGDAGTHPDRARVLTTAGAVGLPIIDVHAAVRGRFDERKLVPYPEAHYNAMGYSIVGDAILDGLAALDRQTR